MKKWHMESIVNFTGGNRKLALPDSSQVQLATVKLREEGREFFLIPPLRYFVGLVVRLF